MIKELIFEGQIDSNPEIIKPQLLEKEVVE